MNLRFFCGVRRSRLAGSAALVALTLLLPLIGALPAVAQAPHGSAAHSTPAVQTSPGAPQSAEEIRRAAAKAYGSLSKQGTWRLQGAAHFRGGEQSFEMFCDSRFRFRTAMIGDLSEVDGYDGSRCWTEGPAAVPHRIILRDRDLTRLFAWTLTGVWALKSSPLLCILPTATPDTTGKLTLLLKPKDGIVTATLTLDAATLLPQSLQYGGDSGEESWNFAEYRAFEGRMLPTHIVHRSGKQEDTIEITTATSVAAETARYQMPKPETAAVEFDTNADRTVEIKRVMGLMFVHPKIDGQDVGWFFLDTGADACCIEPEVAKKLGLAVIGGDTTAGVVGVTHLAIRRAGTFQLGPVTLKRPVFLELGLGAISQALKLPIAGICGYDFFAHTSLDIDTKANTMRISPPGKTPLSAGARWAKIGFEANTPCLECTFAAANRGFFSLDTGSTSTVDFFTPAVEKFQLLKDRNVTTGHTGGAGGVAENRQGKIDWFQIGETRFEKPPVVFQITKTGVFSSPYRLGNIGMSFLGRFRILIDYANERMGFVNTNVAHNGSM